MITNRRNAVPKAAFGICNVLNERQNLDDANKGGHEDRDSRQDNGVIQDGHCISRKDLGCVQGHHQGAISGVEKTHSGYIWLEWLRNELELTCL